MSTKILTVVGARPQFIKAAVVSRALENCGNYQEIIVHTGQHFDANMSTIFFDELEIPIPAYNLGVGGGTHAANTGRAMEALEQVIMQEEPAWVLVYGDTDSTLAGAIAASKLSVPIAHIEAGLRSFNRRMPEEINRVLTDHISTALFAPSKVAVENLATEGISGDHVRLVGDVMYDAALYYGDVASRKSHILESLDLIGRDYILVTLHRKENTDDRDRLLKIVAGLSQSEVPVVWPLHPRTRRRIEAWGISLPSVIRLIEPVGYLDMVLLERHAKLIATDSGGVQKEAYFHKVPCITLRDETEWVELIEIGANRLVGADTDQISKALSEFNPVSVFDEVYGSGNTSVKIVESLGEYK